ncbi:MAG: tRNA epoxyqueuosine(34) reductase QueG [Deltaproteobacteria bacterium]|nr:tRNA epoxyqueuosine(34) reductase QueG [Deltaproteobacteria bacterium]
MSLEDEIKQIGLGLGLNKIAISRADSFPEHAALKNWLDKGFHGSMSWMERGASKRMNPKEVMPGAKSVLTCALNYNTDYPYSVDQKESGRGWISRYAWGEDYHQVMVEMLEQLVQKIRHLVAPACRQAGGTICQFYVDTGPVMERVFAKNSGLGWIGKNTCIIDKKLGSWLFLGAILTDLELKPDPIVMDHCGICTACIAACPTQAITKPHRIDARRCISYLTIEHKGEIEPELAHKMGNHLFGCDICQDVCPWNRKAPKTSLRAFQPREGFFNPRLDDFEEKVTQDYPKGFKNSPLKRAKKEGLLRNMDIAKRK